MSDLISRQAAIEALDVLCQEHRYRIPGKRETYSQYNEAWQDALGRAEGVICNLPSTQPEVIRCTECKHYREYDSEYVENAVVVQCMADRYPISETIPDGWFCDKAERRSDDGM